MTLRLKHWHTVQHGHWAANSSSRFALSAQPVIPLPVAATSQWGEGGYYSHAAVVVCSVCNESILYRRIANKHRRKSFVSMLLKGRLSPHVLELKSGQAHHSIVSDD